MKIYVASSWRNPQQPDVVIALRSAGHEVYDFRNPNPGDTGFSWSDIDPDWLNWDTEQYQTALKHPLAEEGFGKDLGGMEWAEACVLVLPCGRSAHLEAGWFTGRGIPVWILTQDGEEPELMYKLIESAGGVVTSRIEDIIEAMARREVIL